MKSYQVVAWDQRTTYVSAWNESEAMSMAIDFCGTAGVYSVTES
jgi:hypothetical protein